MTDKDGSATVKTIAYGTITMTQDLMCVAIEHYLNGIMFKNPVDVSNIKKEMNKNFEITYSPKE